MLAEIFVQYASANAEAIKYQGGAIYIEKETTNENDFNGCAVVYAAQYYTHPTAFCSFNQ
ncbi:hypothetical protein PAENIP36_09370 [Paenibacillus sp. P36]